MSFLIWVMICTVFGPLRAALTPPPYDFPLTIVVSPETGTPSVVESPILVSPLPLPTFFRRDFNNDAMVKVESVTGSNKGLSNSVPTGNPELKAVETSSHDNHEDGHHRKGRRPARDHSRDMTRDHQRDHHRHGRSSTRFV
ncbi:hypothetical protein BJ742DRAFT_54446 [Cladochytrium replicatum]|nr:hypothetical protein BJ742DRAFT_54446 [Cladochytrium replicatum]